MLFTIYKCLILVVSFSLFPPWVFIKIDHFFSLHFLWWNLYSGRHHFLSLFIKSKDFSIIEKIYKKYTKIYINTKIYNQEEFWKICQGNIFYKHFGKKHWKWAVRLNMQLTPFFKFSFSTHFLLSFQFLLLFFLIPSIFHLVFLFLPS